MKEKIADFVNQSQLTMNHIPVHVVLFIDKHPPETNHVWPTDLTSMCKDFSYGSTVRQMNRTAFGEFCSPRNYLLTWIVGAIFLD